MMKKKLFAALTTLLCLTSTFGGFTAFAEETSEISMEDFEFEAVIVGVDNAEDPTQFILKLNESFYVLFASTLEAHQFEEQLQYGDILTLHGYWAGTAELWDTPPIDGLGGNPYLEKTGSIFESGTTEIYTLQKTERETSYRRLLYDAAGTEFTYDTQFLGKFVFGTHEQPGDFDMLDVKAGDQVLMYSYNGYPFIPAEINPLGDVNSDSVLNVLDVVTMNKHLLTGAELPALANASGEAKLAKSGETDLGQCDFNGNGVIDPDDSLCMLKRIVGLETIAAE